MAQRLSWSVGEHQGLVQRSIKSTGFQNIKLELGDQSDTVFVGQNWHTGSSDWPELCGAGIEINGGGGDDAMYVTLIND